MMLFLTLFAFGSIFVSSSADTFIIYGVGRNITVLSSAGKEIKNFTISLRKIKGIAIHYDEDLIFAADGKKIIKIHLLDNEGNPKISGTGELFLDDKASHNESVILDFARSNEGIETSSASLTVDTNAHKLYMSGKWFVYEMNYDGTDVKKVIGTNFTLSSQYSVPSFKNLLFHGNKAFVHVDIINWNSFSDKEFSGTYEAAINPTEIKNVTTESLISREKDINSIDSMASDNTSRSIFIVKKNHDYQISAWQAEEKEDFTQLKWERILLSNYGVTRKPTLLAVKGRTVAWYSSIDKIFVGKMNKNKTFLPLKDIVVIPRNVETKQIVVFETSSVQSSMVSFQYLLVIMLTFVNAAHNLV